MHACGVAVEADNSEAGGLQLVERPRQVRHEGDRHEFQRAGRGFGEDAIERRAVPARHDQARGSEHGRRAQDGADVMRVGDLIEHQQGSRAGRRREFLERGLGKFLGLEHGPLVHRVGPENLVQVARGGAFDRVFERAQSVDQSPFRILGED